MTSVYWDCIVTSVLCSERQLLLSLQGVMFSVRSSYSHRESCFVLFVWHMNMPQNIL